MNYEILFCPICCFYYDQSDHLPRILTECGHTLCSHCLTSLLNQNLKIIRCPLDNTELSLNNRVINNFPVNLSLKQLIQEASAEEICLEHNEKMKLVCLKDQKKICNECALFGKHKGHKMISMKNIPHEVDKKREETKNMIKSLTSSTEEIKNDVEKIKNSVLGAIRQNFRDLNLQLQGKESEVTDQVDYFFKEYEDGLIKRFSADVTVIHKLEEKVLKYEQFSIEKDSFTLLIQEEEEDPNSPQLNPEMFKKTMCNIQSIFGVSTSAFNQLLQKVIQGFYKAKYPLPGTTKLKSEKCSEDYFTSNVTVHEEHTNNILRAKTIFRLKKVDNILIIRTAQELSREIMISMNEFRFIKDVRINISKTNFTDEDVDFFMSLWKELKSVSSLSLSNSYLYVLGNVLSGLLLAISTRAEQIKRLELNGYIQNNCIVLFLESILSGMNKLEDLALNLFIPLEGLTILIENNQVILNSLISLRIRFYPCLNDQIFEIFTQKMLPLMQSLQNLQIDLSDLSLVDDSIIQLLNNIPNLVKLDLAGANISKNTVEALSRNLERMFNLEELAFGISDTKICDEDMTSLWRSIPSIKKLSLAVNGTQLTDKTLVMLADKILLFSKDIKSFRIDLSDLNITDKGVSAIISKSNSVTDLKVVLENTQVTDDFKKDLQLVHLPNIIGLNKLLVSFGNSEVFELLTPFELITEKKADNSN